MADKYEYHKRNDYPGERVDERKRVADRAEAADKRSDARVREKGRTEGLKADNRVARKGRMDDELMDAEIERSTARAQRVNRGRNTADIIGLAIVAGILVILLVGFGWTYIAMQQQSDEIDSLKTQLAVTPKVVNIELSNANKQIQLYKDFLVLTADVKQEVKDLEVYNNSYSNMYQLCADYVDRLNNVNLAMSRFAEKEIIYYRQIAVLADKPQCKAKIDVMDTAMKSSITADEKYYVQNSNKCGKLTNIQSPNDNMVWVSDLKKAFDDSTAKAKAFTNAEKDVIACFA